MARSKTPRGGNPFTSLEVGSMVPAAAAYPDGVVEVDKKLVALIKKEGLAKPIVVMQEPDSPYQIVSGSRQWKAAVAAGLDAIPVGVIRGFSDAEIALLHGIGRAYENDDCDVIERMDTLAEAAAVISRKFSLQPRSWLDMPTVLAAIVGYSRSFVTMELRMQSSLSPELKDLYARGPLSRTSAYTVSSWDHATMVLFEEILAESGELARKDITDIVHELDAHLGSDAMLDEAMRWIGYAARLSEIDGLSSRSVAIEQIGQKVASLKFEQINYEVTEL